MKINLAIDCTPDSIANTLVALHSFLDKNRWFSGKVYVLTPKANTLTKRNFSDISTIYQDYEVVDCSNFSILFSDFLSNPATLEKLISVYSLIMPVNRLIYLSSQCIVMKDVSEILLPDSIVTTMNPSEETCASMFYRSSAIPVSLLTNELVSDLVCVKNSITELISYITKPVTANVIVTRSSDFNDIVWIKKKTELANVHVIRYNTLRKDNRFSTKINQIWLQHNNSIQRILKRPAFRHGQTLIKSNTVDWADSPITKSQVLNSKEADVSISIIIPAFKASTYIKECLDSIKSQIKDKKIEILIGVDACSETLDTLKTIKDDYSELRIFYSSNSAGAYVMRNSLVNEANNSTLLFFDADDIMMPTMISHLLKSYRALNPIRFKYINFNSGESHVLSRTVNPKVAHGVFFIDRKLFDKIGGFQKWPCGADTEFMKRCSSNKIKDLALETPLFYRRIHKESLTQSARTGYKSKIRSEINNKIKTTRDWRIPVTRHTTKLIEIK